MTLHHPQPRSPAAFAFPSRTPARDHDHHSTSGLQPAFTLPARNESLAQYHQPQPSTSSASSASHSASSRGRGYSSATSRSVASTSYTSVASSSDDCGYDDEDCYSDAGQSVLDDLYDDLAASTRRSITNADSPPRFLSDMAHDSDVDSAVRMRERTRYRSSASVVAAHQHPLGAFGNLSISSSLSPPAALAPSHQHADEPARPRPSHMSLLSALASASSSSLDRCFCGALPEEDSIYCSRACAQADALNALCGGSSGAEDAGQASSSDAASWRSSSASGSSGRLSGGESHYRRVEREEARRQREKERAARREERERKAAKECERAAAQAFEEEERKIQHSLRRFQHPQQSDVGRERQQHAYAPPPRTSSRRTPSLSSSISSLASSAAPSPISPSFSTAPPSPWIVEPASPDDTTFPTSSSHALAPPLRPCTPNAHMGATAGDVYASYLATTPLANDKLRTPTQHPYGLSPSSSCSPDGLHSTPRAAGPFPYSPGPGQDDDSPTQRGAGAGADVGLRMLELCASDSSESEADEAEYIDRVAPLRQHRRGAPLGGGHTKGKLSFDDVVGILGAQ
ncbi:hypothetical protein Rhopal_007553-T1 [Rhodotorula paludigena]|uniref:Proteophosphoglycan ppg4 n=1 Tax=Rhodotorula paludigena TaxID=86838 RepID=A0AAV5GW62_9BASI|nr:hypothetical protein Rhopal_007553-T1 [Rhodotorula paludigena]